MLPVTAGHTTVSHTKIWVKKETHVEQFNFSKEHFLLLT